MLCNPPAKLFRVKSQPVPDLDVRDLTLPAHPMHGIRSYAQVRRYLTHLEKMPAPFLVAAWSHCPFTNHDHSLSHAHFDSSLRGSMIPARIAWKISARVRNSGSDIRSIATMVTIQPPPWATPTITYSAALPVPRT